MVRERLYRAFGLIAALVVVGALSNRLAPPLAVALAAPQLGGTPAEQLSAAADTIEAALAKGGSGLTFEVVQRNTLYAKPDGPRIGVRLPEDPQTVVAEVDEFYVNGITSRGAVTDTAFWMDNRAGQAPLARTLSIRQRVAGRMFPSLGKSYMGTAYHNAVATQVARISRNRIQYNRVGMDFVEARRGIRVELTTRGQVARHIVRDGYGPASYYTRYVKYDLW